MHIVCSATTSMKLRFPDLCSAEVTKAVGYPLL